MLANERGVKDRHTTSWRLRGVMDRKSMEKWNECKDITPGAKLTPIASHSRRAVESLNIHRNMSRSVPV